VDTKGTGKDYLSAPIAYVYGNEVYIEDVVFTNELPEFTIPKVTSAVLEHKVQRLYIEAQSGGEYFGRILEEQIKKGGGNTAIRTFFTTKNKEVKIVMQSDFVKKNFIFKDKSLYSKNSAYGEFMRQLLSYSQTAKKNKHDDAPDSVAMLAEFIQTLVGNKVQILDRRSLRI
jgi:predicted phage terminase large subunit-like protein